MARPLSTKNKGKAGNFFTVRRILTTLTLFAVIGATAINGYDTEISFRKNLSNAGNYIQKTWVRAFSKISNFFSSEDKKEVNKPKKLKRLDESNVFERTFNKVIEGIEDGKSHKNKPTNNKLKRLDESNVFERTFNKITASQARVNTITTTEKHFAAPTEGGRGKFRANKQRNFKLC